MWSFCCARRIRAREFNGLRLSTRRRPIYSEYHTANLRYASFEKRLPAAEDHCSSGRNKGT